METFCITLALLGMGMAMRRLSRFPRETAQVLNLFVLYFSLPALILLKVSRLRFSQEVLLPALMPWVMVLVGAALVALAARWRRWPREVTGTLLMLVPLGNTAFLGIPMVQAFHGEEGIPYAVLYDQLGSFPALAVYGTLVLSVFGSGPPQGGVAVARRIITFPPFIAFVLALVLRGMTLPLPLASLLEALAATMVPLVMIAVGRQLTLRLQRDILEPFAAGLLLRLVVSPLVALLLCRLAGLDGLVARVTAFEAAMPPMVTAGALAIAAGFPPVLVAALVGYGILAALVTLPLLSMMW